MDGSDLNSDSLPQPDDGSDPLTLAIWFNRLSGIGPRYQTALLDHFGSAGRVYQASRSELMTVHGIGTKLADVILRSRSLAEAIADRERFRRLGISLFPIDSERYPQPLTELPDSPQLLYCRGSLTEADTLAVAIVGSRRCTDYGSRMARRIAHDLAASGVTVVSGLARGIDAAAHHGALEGGGRTIAVTACGMGTIYPPEHVELAEEVVSAGAILCEVHHDQKPLPGLFPQRNRIISGLSLGIVVIEAQRKSGALHTARHANEQGRDVFAVPGRVDSPASEGSLELLRDGAILVRNAEDVLEALGPLAKPVQKTETQTVLTPRELNLNEQERAVLNAIGLEPRPIDQIVRDIAIDASRVLATLTLLEMKQLVRRLPGSLVARRT